jgi:hypothetical protein
MMIVVIFLVLLQLGSLYVIYNMYKKYETLEKISQENVDFIVSIRSRVMSQQSYLKQLDRKGAFESDDELGYFFKELKKIINDIVFYLEIEDGETSEERSPSVLGSIRSQK